MQVPRGAGQRYAEECPPRPRSRRAPLRAVVFDLDGVIIDSEQLMRGAFADSYRRVIGSSGSPPVETYLEHMGKPFPEIMNILGLPGSLWEPYRRFCRSHLDLVTVHPECLPLLRWVRQHGLRVGLFTGKDAERTKEVLDYFCLTPAFDATVCSDEIEAAKPHPDGLLHVLDLLACRPAEAVFVGDAVDDVECARRAGVTSVAVTWGIKPERLRMLCAPDHVIDEWPALQALLVDRLSTADL